MKKLSFVYVIAAAIAMLSFRVNSDKEKTTNYQFDTEKSRITWLGKKVTGEHTGNIKLAEGNVHANGGKLTAGSFKIDMNSITCTDLEDEKYNAKLIGHLKSDDFFSSDKHKHAEFIIKSVKPAKNNQHEVTGDLTIKGIKQTITFPATVKIDGKQLTATAKVKVNRTKFDIKYGSGSFFDGLGDKMIYDDFELDLNLVATTK
ncbi:YceI family protein [Cytophagaceae bacterium ABcell3]|nr:YceI family protein [Cytophagaceae bacterium ABcell3]